MEKASRLGLIAALTCFSAFSLPRSSPAETVYGAWTGVDSFNSTVYLNGLIVSESSGSDIPAGLNIAFADPDFFFVQISISDVAGNDVSVLGPALSHTLGPQYASASVNEYGGNSDLSGDFDVTYQSILPDGMIDSSGGFGVADISYEVFDYNTGTYTVGFISFEGQGVPEPSSLVLAATGVLVIVIFAWMRGGSPSVLALPGRRRRSVL